jgi:hypothetical protein
MGMGLTFAGLLTLAFAPNFHVLLLAAALVGSGSSVFHPEASRVARLASGGRHGFAQSFFQVGGNAGSAFGPVLAAWFIIPKEGLNNRCDLVAATDHAEKMASIIQNSPCLGPVDHRLRWPRPVGRSTGTRLL